MGLYAPPPGGHGVLDPRQTNRLGKKYREEALWDGSGNAGEKIEITEVKKQRQGFLSILASVFPVLVWMKYVKATIILQQYCVCIMQILVFC